MAANRKEDIHTFSHMPVCPVCHQADQVQPMQTAYERGAVQGQVPAVARRRKGWWVWILVALIIYGGANFYLFAQLGGAAGFGAWPVQWQVAEVVVIEIVLLIGLLVSILAFARTVKTKQETVWRYPDQNPANQNLYHCGRDNVTFDAQRQQVLSPEETERRLRLLSPNLDNPGEQR